MLGFGVLFLRLHTLPERMAHKSHKLQFEIVAVLGLISLFTHMHIFWVAGLLLALIDLPDFGTPLSRIAGSAEKIAGISRAREPPNCRETGRRRPDDAATDVARGVDVQRWHGEPVDPRARSAEDEGADPCLSFCSARC